MFSFNFAQSSRIEEAISLIAHVHKLCHGVPKADRQNVKRKDGTPYGTDQFGYQDTINKQPRQGKKMANDLST